MKSKFGFGRSTRQIWENLYLFLAIVVILLAIPTLFLASSYQVTFTICFFVAAVMQICQGCAFMCLDEKHRRSYGWAAVLFVTAAALIILGIISLKI